MKGKEEFPLFFTLGNNNFIPFEKSLQVFKLFTPHYLMEKWCDWVISAVQNKQESIAFCLRTVVEGTLCQDGLLQTNSMMSFHKDF